jgi:protein involved in temperature-dependent protein secretion
MDWDDAIHQYKIILEENPSNFDVRLNLLDLYVKVGDFKKACSIIEHLFEIRLESYFPEQKEKHFKSILNNMRTVLSRAQLPQNCQGVFDSVLK